GIDTVSQVAPGTGDVSDVRLAAQLAFRADLARHPRHLRRERTQLVHHRVDRPLDTKELPLERLAVHLQGDGESDVRGERADVADLAGEVASHEVDTVREVLPGAGHALDLGLAAQLPLRPDLARHPRHLRGERTQLVHHRVDRPADTKELPLERLALDLQ